MVSGIFRGKTHWTERAIILNLAFNLITLMTSSSVSKSSTTRPNGHCSRLRLWDPIKTMSQPEIGFKTNLDVPAHFSCPRYSIWNLFLKSSAFFYASISHTHKSSINFRNSGRTAIFYFLQNINGDKATRSFIFPNRYVRGRELMSRTVFFIT